MIHPLWHIHDQFDQSISSNEMEKRASILAERQTSLAEAPLDDFAVVIYDGHSYSRKFPLQTADDVQMSKEAFDRSVDSMPSEIAKVARVHIEVAGRQFFGESLFGETVDLSDAPLTNIVYAGHVDERAYEQKMSKTASAQAPACLLPGHQMHPIPVPTGAAVLQAEKGLAKYAFVLTDEDRRQACRGLVKRAGELGVELSSDEVTRFGREVVPAAFETQVTMRREAAPEKLASFFDRLLSDAHEMGPEAAAQCLVALDKLAGFSHNPVARGQQRVGTEFARVEDVFFPVSEPVVVGQDLSKVASFFGDTFAESYRADATSARASLSPEERTLLEIALSAR